MATMYKILPADPVAGRFDRHIEEFRDFFRSRGLSFGSPGDLPAFVERVGVDAAFRDEVGSIVRTVIYRERDGLSRPELVGLVVSAVGGPEAEDAAEPELREAARQIAAVVESVFRTRLNPGAASPVRVEQPAGSGVAGETLAPVPVGVEHAGGEVVAAQQDTAEAVQVEAQPHGMTDLFYRAQVVAGAEPAEAIAEERKVENAKADSAPQAGPAHDRFRPVERVRESLPAVDYGVLPLASEAPEETELPKRTSRFWMWTAAVCALLLAFCAGLFVHQRLLVPLRDANQPYEAPPADTAPEVNAEQSAAAGPVASRAPVRGRRAEEARSRASVRRGRGEFAASGSRASAPSGATSAAEVAPASKAVEPVDRASAGAVPPQAEREVSSAGGAANLQPRYMAPAMIGASPALMADRLVYAPPPTYPMLAEISRIHGRVLVEAVVGKSGQVIRAEAISGHRLLRGAAVREVFGRRYRPYLLNDRPTDVATIVTVDFRPK